MPGVFISYRREDSSGYTGRLFDILSAEFGRENTFMDLDTIEGGDDFASVINQKINVSDVLIAVIGDRWLKVTEQDGTRRLDNPRDFVRIEIAEALQRGIRVIPVLVAGATLPLAHDLPDDLRPLCDRQAVEIRDSHFHQDAQQLTHVLHSTLHGIAKPARKVKRLVPAFLVGAAVIVGSGVLLFRDRQPTPLAVQQETTPPRTAATVPGVDPAPTGAGLGGKTPQPQPETSIAGQWTATVKYDWGDTYQEKFDFELDGQALSGTAGLLGVARTIRDGKITGNRVTFVTKTMTTLGADQSEDTHTYKATIEGDTIRFTMVTDSKVTEHTPIHFVASRVKDK